MTFLQEVSNGIKSHCQLNIQNLTGILQDLQVKMFSEFKASAERSLKHKIEKEEKW